MADLIAPTPFGAIPIGGKLRLPLGKHWQAQGLYNDQYNIVTAMPRRAKSSIVYG